MLCAVIMAGGKGTRFWPMSTEDNPKQFLNLVGDKTMIQMTVDRILPIIPMERVYICTGERYVDLIKEQLPQLPVENIIIEPEGRNTAPCITLSSLVIRRKYKDATMVVLPSDHLIEFEDKFREIILLGEDYLNNKNDKGILTLGMKPNRPETGYGYIKYDINSNTEICKVDKFVEKPNIEKAEEYLREGNYLWNGGMFIWKINTILDEIKRYIPNTYEALSEIETVEESKLQKVINEKYSKTDEISIDYAVLEKSNEIYVIKSNIGWDDIGTWNSVERYKSKDENNNVLTENSVVIEANNNMIINNNKKIVMVGVNDLLAIETEDAFYIVSKDKMGNLKEYQDSI